VRACLRSSEGATPFFPRTHPRDSVFNTESGRWWVVGWVGGVGSVVVVGGAREGDLACVCSQPLYRYTHLRACRCVTVRPQVCVYVRACVCIEMSVTDTPMCVCCAVCCVRSPNWQHALERQHVLCAVHCRGPVHWWHHDAVCSRHLCIRRPQLLPVLPRGAVQCCGRCVCGQLHRLRARVLLRRRGASGPLPRWPLLLFHHRLLRQRGPQCLCGLWRRYHVRIVDAT
jgi:hypothetical protein